MEKSEPPLFGQKLCTPVNWLISGVVFTDAVYIVLCLRHFQTEVMKTEFERLQARLPMDMLSMKRYLLNICFHFVLFYVRSVVTLETYEGVAESCLNGTFSVCYCLLHYCCYLQCITLDIIIASRFFSYLLNGALVKFQ